MNYLRAWLLLGFLILVGLILGPVFNFLPNRLTVKVISPDKDFLAVSTCLQNSCMDCHTPGATILPWYANMPIASDIIYSDIANAQGAFIISRENLSGEAPFDSVQLNKIKMVLEQNSMPPVLYLAMHWNGGVGSSKNTMLKWIDKASPNYGLKPIPKEDPFHSDAEKVQLGKHLYFDNRLSVNDTISCSSCHSFDRGGADGAIVSAGVKGQKGVINAPTVFNSAFNFVQFWDGRAASLKEQVTGPVTNPVEMGSMWSQVIDKLAKDEQYVADFAKSYPPSESSTSKHSITVRNISDAISTYEQTLITPNCRFDRYLQGDKQAINSDEEAGYKLFVSHNCVSCHTGINFGSESFEKMGVKKNYFAWRGHLTNADNGRYNVTHEEKDRFEFKVPTLRNVALTAPYFHDGSVNDLNVAVKIMGEYQVGQLFSDQEAQLVTKFLNTLTGEYNGKQLTLENNH